MNSTRRSARGRGQNVLVKHEHAPHLATLVQRVVQGGVSLLRRSRRNHIRPCSAGKAGVREGMVCVRVCGCGAYFEHVLPFCRNGVAAVCARSWGKPSSARCEQRLSERLTLPVRSRARLHRNTGSRGKKENTGKRCSREAKATRIFRLRPTRSAASRAGMAGWAGRVGPIWRAQEGRPHLPSTPRQHGAARHQTPAVRNSLPPQKPGQKRHATSARRGFSPPNTSAGKRQPRNSTPPQKPGQKRQYDSSTARFATKHVSRETLPSTPSRHAVSTARLATTINQPRNGPKLCRETAHITPPQKGDP